MKNKIPKGWADYLPFGDKVEGTNLFPFKTPLKQEMQSSIPTEQRFTPGCLIVNIPKLRAVIDLTDTDSRADRYYCPKDFIDSNVDHLKLRISGGGLVPGMDKILMFSDAVDGFLRKFSDDPDALIGVHCTHGLNRTGYFICMYMVTRMRCDPVLAIDRFQKARGYEMYRQNFIEEIMEPGKHTSTRQAVRYGRENKEKLVRPIGNYSYANDWLEGIPKRSVEQPLENKRVGRKERHRRRGGGFPGEGGGMEGSSRSTGTFPLEQAWRTGFPVDTQPPFECDRRGGDVDPNRVGGVPGRRDFPHSRGNSSRWMGTLPVEESWRRDSRGSSQFPSNREESRGLLPHPDGREESPFPLGTQKRQTSHSFGGSLKRGCPPLRGGPFQVGSDQREQRFPLGAEGGQRIGFPQARDFYHREDNVDRLQFPSNRGEGRGLLPHPGGRGRGSNWRGRGQRGRNVEKPRDQMEYRSPLDDDGGADGGTHRGYGSRGCGGRPRR